MSLIKHVLKPNVSSINYAVQNAIKKVENKRIDKGKSLERTTAVGSGSSYSASQSR